MRSHFLPQKVSAVCAVAGATTLLSGSVSAQSFVAADYATNPTYAGGWTNGQNGGFGFGAWSFFGSNTNPPTGPYQFISTASPVGESWTLATYALHSGLADVGRAISEPGGLQPGQTLEAVIDNPTGYHYYRGFDILCFNGTNNAPGGINEAALRAQVFSYGGFNNWIIDDSNGDNDTPLTITNTAVAGMKFDLTLLTTNTYFCRLTPLGNPASAFSLTGTLPYTSVDKTSGLTFTNLPITWISFRLYWGISTGLNDTANNFEISSMTIAGTSLNIQAVGANAILSWSTNVPGFYLESTPNLNSPIVWTSNSVSPATINGLNVVTNPITGHQQYFRLQLQQ
jgi:hypothetical protein